MNPVDLTIFIVYIFGVLGVGYYFMLRNEGAADYYIGGRKISYPHIGLSVVATDVGGGFSIGLGGLGFIMGLSGSWMLFTGFLGAWLSAVYLIPKVKDLSTEMNFYTMPDLFGHFFSPRAALIAGFISAIGYIGFTSSQMLAGAKLASASFEGLGLDAALYIMGIIIVVYTVMGGIKAVIYTDTFQWILLMSGLVFIGIPISYFAVGGMDGIREAVPADFLTLTNITWQQCFNWGVTIIPIWFVGMTLYQRIYSSRSEKEAQKAWYVAGFFEWPIMAFMGVLLGMFAHVGAEQGMFSYMGFDSAGELDAEMGLPFLLRTVLPVGLMGLMMSAYFSAIMSTADSCLVAASGNVSSDILGKVFNLKWGHTRHVRFSQIVTLVLGFGAVLLAATMENVLEIMLYSYAFMVSGLLVPVIGALYWKKSSSAGAIGSMIIGGGTTLVLTVLNIPLPMGLDPNIFGITAALILFISLSLGIPDKKTEGVEIR
ncbi:MAG: sodium:solute symporter family protein [Balneolales bacterium]